MKLGSLIIKFEPPNLIDDCNNLENKLDIISLLVVIGWIGMKVNPKPF